MITINKKYTRSDIYQVFNVPRKMQGGAWLRGHHNYKINNNDAIHFIFANIGTVGLNKNKEFDYDNSTDDKEELLDWVTQKQRSQDNPIMIDLSNSKPLIFISDNNKNTPKKWKFIGLGTINTIEGNKPVKIRWNIEKNQKEIDHYLRKTFDSVTNPISLEDNNKYKLFSTDIPQADNVFRLFEIVELVSSGRWRYVHFKHDLDITYRQGQY